MVLSRQILLDKKSCHSSTEYSIVRATEPRNRVASPTSSREKGSSDGKSRRQMTPICTDNCSRRNTTKRAQSESSFGTIEVYNRVANPTTPRGKGYSDGRLHR
jgi:hypothetical protein